VAARWTEEEEAKLLKLRQEGFTSKEIAMLLKRTHGAVRNRITALATDNLNRKWTEKEIELALTLKADQRTNKYIAKALNRTPAAVASFLLRYWNNEASKPLA
jgi:transcriptional regulator